MYIVKHDNQIIKKTEVLEEAKKFAMDYIYSNQDVANQARQKIYYVRIVGPNSEKGKWLYFYDFGSWSHFIYIFEE